MVERGIIRDRTVVLELARRNIKTQYRGSVLGVLWTILNPLLTMLVMWFVFETIFGNGVYYPLYLLCGNVVFTAFRACTQTSLTSIQLNRNSMLRTKIHPYVFPCSLAFTSLINFSLTLVALIPFMIWKTVAVGVNLFTWRLVFILLMMPAFWLFTYGISLFLGVLYVFFRDLKNLYQVFILLWQYLTPIFYTVDRIVDSKKPAGKLAAIAIKLNPMFHFTNYLRECVYLGAAGIDKYHPGNAVNVAASYAPNFGTLGILYACGILATLIGVGLYEACKNKMMVRL